MGVKNEVNGGKLISSGVKMIIYDKYCANIQFQSILDLVDSEIYKKVRLLRLILWR